MWRILGRLGTDFNSAATKNGDRCWWQDKCVQFWHRHLSKWRWDSWHNIDGGNSMKVMLHILCCYTLKSNTYFEVCSIKLTQTSRYQGGKSKPSHGWHVLFKEFNKMFWNFEFGKFFNPCTSKIGQVRKSSLLSVLDIPLSDSGYQVQFEA